jgi:hypothetical protein
MKIIYVLILTTIITSCGPLEEISRRIEPSQFEMTSAMRQALEQGTGSAVTNLNRENGFYRNPAVMIPFPPEAVRAANTLRDLGMGKLVDDFILTMNRAAETAAAEAQPIFVNAIREMTVQDVRNIILGHDSAATVYFKDKTQQQLYNAFQPHIKQALDQVNATRYWTDITSTYNQLPMVKKIETDLARYTTLRALDGLFFIVRNEEKLIREDPAKRTTDILRRVFGWAATQQQQ